MPQHSRTVTRKLRSAHLILILTVCARGARWASARCVCLLQELNIHTSCSVPLQVGDVYGGLTLTGFTCPTYTKVEEKTVGAKISFGERSPTKRSFSSGGATDQAQHRSRGVSPDLFGGL